MLAGLFFPSLMKAKTEQCVAQVPILFFWRDGLFLWAIFSIGWRKTCETGLILRPLPGMPVNKGIKQQGAET